MARNASFPISAARLLGAAALVAALGGAAVSVSAQGGPGHFGGHGGMGPYGGPGVGMMQGRMGERMLDAVNASAEQRAQIRQITERRAAEMQAQRDAHRALREQGVKLFSQPVVDANAAEALRQQMMQQHDQASRRMLQTMLEISRVLTPEQRKLMADRMAQRGEMMRRHFQERQQLEGAPARK